MAGRYGRDYLRETVKNRSCQRQKIEMEIRKFSLACFGSNNRLGDRFLTDVDSRFWPIHIFAETVSFDSTPLRFCLHRAVFCFSAYRIRCDGMAIFCFNGKLALASDLGKKLCNMIVVNTDGTRLSFWQATFRIFVKYDAF